MLHLICYGWPSLGLLLAVVVSACQAPDTGDGCRPCEPAACDDTGVQGSGGDTARGVPGDTAAAEEDCPACVADFAIYDPEEEEDGVWEDEVTALQTMLAAFEWSYEVVDAQDLNQGALGTGSDRRYRALVAPGGSAWYRDQETSEAGEAHVRAFLSRGGGYVGFCAGTSWTADTILWAEEATGGGGTYNRPLDYATYHYDLGVFQGAIQAPFGWEPWGGGLRVSLEPAALDLSISTLATIGVPEETWLFYYGGPVYQPTGVPAEYEVWARAVMPEGLPADASTGADEPTIVHYRYGEGTVILFSYHPVILVESMVDGVQLTGAVDETTLDWEAGEQGLEEANLQSWNLLHAALQQVAGWEPTPLEALPAR